MPSYSEIYNYLFNYRLITIMSIKNRRTIKLYDHVEKFISSFSMSKVVAYNKLPNKSVNRLPYHIKMAKQFGLGFQ